VALKIGAASPPTISVAWCANNGGSGSPIVTTTDGHSQPVVWSVGSENSNRLQAFNGETGEMLFAGGGAAEQMNFVHRFQTPIVVNGRIFVAGDNELYAFTMK
jgi:outer membrane protein assembly factor BamB